MDRENLLEPLILGNPHVLVVNLLVYITNISAVLTLIVPETENKILN
jgi:hypothetical protein